MNILDEYIGHFSNTSLGNGNIGLAAHNRGYKNNYFENIDKLKINDKIIYEYNYNKKVFLVKNIFLIDSTDWSCLRNDNKDKNTITLITCVRNKPDKRLVVKATEDI